MHVLMLNKNMKIWYITEQSDNSNVRGKVREKKEKIKS